MHTKFWPGNLKGRDHLEDLGVDGKIILEWILGKQGGKVWTGSLVVNAFKGIIQAPTYIHSICNTLHLSIQQLYVSERHPI